MSLFGKKYSEPLTKEDTERVFKIGRLLSVSAIVFMATFTLLVHYDFVRLYPSSTTPEKFVGFATRVEYALRYQTLLVLWLIVNIIITIYGRLTKLALNPLDEHTERRVQMYKNILTNSFETTIVSIFSQLIFISYASPRTILKFVPMINIIQFIGRITFFAGYPLARAFGFFNTFLPTLVLTAFNVYHFTLFVFHLEHQGSSASSEGFSRLSQLNSTIVPQ